MYHNHTSFINNNLMTIHRFDCSEYCNSVLDCTDSEGNLSYPNVMQLLGDNGQSYYEYAEDCGHDYHANTILSWLGY